MWFKMNPLQQKLYAITKHNIAIIMLNKFMNSDLLFAEIAYNGCEIYL